MVLLEKLWDDVVAGPQPERGLGRLRRISTSVKDHRMDGSERLAEGNGGSSYKYQGSAGSMPASPATPRSPPVTPVSGRKENVWRSVFHPGSNTATRSLGNAVFDKPSEPNSPTIYDWLYSSESRSQHR